MNGVAFSGLAGNGAGITVTGVDFAAGNNPMSFQNAIGLSTGYTRRP